MALIERGTGDNVQQDNNLSVKVNLELPKKGSFIPSDGAGSIMLKPNNLLSYKGNDDVAYEIPIGEVGTSNLQQVMSAGNTSNIPLIVNGDSVLTGEITLLEGSIEESNFSLAAIRSTDVLLEAYSDIDTGSVLQFTKEGTWSILGQISNTEARSIVSNDLEMFSVTDTVNNKGLEYTGDYESNFTGRSLVTKQYVESLSPVTPDLQSVTDGVGNNTTSNSLSVSGVTNFSTSVDAVQILHAPDGSDGGIVKTSDGIISNSLSFTPTKTQLNYDNGTNVSALELRTETPSIAGVSMGSRAEFNPGINVNDGVVMSQLPDLSTVTLQTTTSGAGSNRTSNMIGVTGISNSSLATDGLYLLHVPGGSQSSVVKTVSNSIKNSLDFTPTKSELFFSGSTSSHLTLQVQNGSQSGAAFDTRVSGSDPLLTQDFATKGYTDTALTGKANLTGGNTFTGNQTINANVGINVTPTTPLHVKGIAKIERTNTTQYVQIDAEGGSTNILGKNTTDGTYNQIIITQGNNSLNREVMRFDTVGNALISGKATITGAPTAATDAVRKTELDLKASLASPALTGTPTAPTATVGNNTTQIATTAFGFSNFAPKAIESAATTAQTSATLNASYPSAAAGQFVVAPLVGSGMLFVKKADGNWTSFVGSNI